MATPLRGWGRVVWLYISIIYNIYNIYNINNMCLYVCVCVCVGVCVCECIIHKT